jgi:cell division protein FtsN
LLSKLRGFGFCEIFQNRISAKMVRISPQNLGKTLLILFSLSLFSCMKNSDEGSSFRIVGLNGESRQLKTRVPELNARILESQGHPLSQQDIATSQAQPQPPQNQQFVASPNANFGSDTSGALRDTMQAEQEKPTYNVASNEVAKQPENTTVGAAEKETEIQYDLSDSEKSAKKSEKKMKLKSGKSVEVKSESKSEKVANDDEDEVPVTDKKKGIFVQTGSFSDKNNAKQDLAVMQKFHKGKIEEGNFGEKKIYRVLLGPFPNAKKAKDTVVKIKASGHDAIVVKNK